MNIFPGDVTARNILLVDVTGGKGNCCCPCGGWWIMLGQEFAIQTYLTKDIVF